MNGTELPPRQYDCLQAIASHWRAYNEGPTRSELGKALGITKVSAHLLVDKLCAQGLVTRERGVHRGLTLR
jgi:DNA-binding MarR family transcriptional regulator